MNSHLKSNTFHENNPKVFDFLWFLHWYKPKVETSNHKDVKVENQYKFSLIEQKSVYNAYDNWKMIRNSLQDSTITYPIVPETLFSRPFSLATHIDFWRVSRRAAFSRTPISWFCAPFTFANLRQIINFVSTVRISLPVMPLRVLFEKFLFGLLFSIKLDYFHHLLVLFLQTIVLGIALFYGLPERLDFLVVLHFFCGDFLFSHLLACVHHEIFLLEFFDLVFEPVLFFGELSFVGFHLCNILVPVLWAEYNGLFGGEIVFSDVEKSVGNLGRSIWRFL